MNNKASKVDIRPLALGALRVIMAALSALALCYGGYAPSQAEVSAITGEGARGIFSLLAYLRLALAPPGLMGCLLFAALLALYNKLYIQRRERWRISGFVLAILFALLTLTGKSMDNYGDLSLFGGRIAQWCTAELVVAGYTFVYHSLIVLLYRFAEKRAAAPEAPERGKWAEGLTGGRGAWLPAAAIALCWLPYIAAYYPGSLSWDATNQLNMFFGWEIWYNAHPVLSTALMGSCVSAGRALGSDNLGLFLYVLLQSAALAAACGYSVRCMARWGAHIYARALALGFFALVPLWPLFAQWVVKDSLYIAFALLFSCRAMDMCLGRRESVDIKALAGLSLLGLLCCLLRKNGVLLVLPTLLALILAFGSKRGRAALAGAFACVGLMFALFNYALVPALGIGGESRAELLSIPLQQTARYLRDYPEEVTVEEALAIQGVLKDGPVSALALAYSPRISDPVKKLYSNNATAEQRRAYAAAWLSMTARRPISALTATVANTYAYYCPEAGRDSLLFYGSWIEKNPLVNLGELAIDYPEGSEGERALLYEAGELASRLPPTWACYSQGLYTWLLLALGFYACVKKRPGLLAGMCPAIATVIMCLLSSVNGELRYFMPVIAAAPMLCAAVMAELRKRTKEEAA